MIIKRVKANRAFAHHKTRVVMDPGQELTEKDSVGHKRLSVRRLHPGADYTGESANGSSMVLKVAHHGSKNSTTKAFLDRTNPNTALISAGKVIPTDLHRETLERLIEEFVLLLYKVFYFQDFCVIIQNHILRMEILLLFRKVINYEVLYSVGNCLVNVYYSIGLF